MKIIAMSDLHGHLPKEVPKGDIVCICGDTIPLDIQRDKTLSIAWFTQKFIPWASSLEVAHVLLISGNHDFFLEDITHKQMRVILQNTKIKWLDNKSFKYGTKVFYGFPYQDDLVNWAFYKERDTFKSILKQIPKKVDILLSHIPPFDLGDLGRVSQPYCKPLDYGSYDLATLLQERDIEYIICGHVHSGNHTLTQLTDKTKGINVSIKDEYYHVYYPITTFDIDD